jgi:hypothetical protein
MKIVLDIPDDWDENKCLQINADIEGQGQYKVNFQMPPHDAQFYNMKDYYLYEWAIKDLVEQMIVDILRKKHDAITNTDLLQKQIGMSKETFKK